MKRLIFLLSCLLAFSATQSIAAPLQEGKDYRLVTPHVATLTKNI